jgi:mannose-1-phosphate guanylyltransferase
MAKLVPVILCGGSGTRLWPRSRAVRPKPFLPLIGDRTLFEMCLDRCREDELFAPPIIVAGRSHLPLVEEQAGASDEICVEPVARGTAAAIALAALRLPEDAIMFVCPSDHYIADVAAFRAAARDAATLANEGWLVSLAIEASSPHTGFGYIQRGEPLGSQGYRTARFVEKPDRATAEQFLLSGDYAWNGGIFALQAGRYLEELQKFRPDIVEALRLSVEGGVQNGRQFDPEPTAFAKSPSESIDYAVMEKTERAAMVPVHCGWSDIGAWDALSDVLSKDDQGHIVQGRAELVDCRNVFVSSDGPRVSVIGLDDVVIVVDGDEILVTTRDGAQKVGKLQGAIRQ